MRTLVLLQAVLAADALNYLRSWPLSSPHRSIASARALLLCRNASVREGSLSHGQSETRRSFFFNGLAVPLLSPIILPFQAAAEDKEPLDARVEFSKVKAELERGGIATLGGLVEKEDWEGILAFTKLYDLSFRKFLLKSAAESLTDPDAQEKV